MQASTCRLARRPEPGVDARHGIELPCVGLQLPPGMQGVYRMDPRETWSKDVKGSNGIDGKDSGAGACLRGSTEQTADCLRAGARAEAVLVGHACLLEVEGENGEMLREHAEDETPQHIPDCEGPDPASWLAQRDKPRDADAVRHGRRHFRIG